MGVIGARVPLVLERTIRDYCRGLGKTPSAWFRELIEREISGKAPNPAIGDAVGRLSDLVSDNTNFMLGILAVSLSIYNTLLRSEISNHPEEAGQLENAHRELVGLLQTLPLKEQLSGDMEVRIADLASEIERIKNKNQPLKKA